MSALRALCLSCLILALLATPTEAHAQPGSPTVSIESLLNEMVDRATLAKHPSPAYSCRQFSSYDRDSTDPDDQSTWFANWDRSQFIRTEERDGRKEYVMMDAEGPGAMVRFWATWHGPGGGEFSNGVLRVYIDGQQEPVIEGPLEDVIDGGMLAGQPLSQGVSPQTEYAKRGHNLYLPIPYAKSCKVTYSTDVLVDQGAREGEALYYQINYRTYEPGVRVESFSMKRLDDAKSKLRETQRLLTADERSLGENLKSENWKGDLAPEQSQTIATIDGGGAVRQIKLRIEADDMDQALRSTVLCLRFDGGQTVWAPVGDFFGVGYELNAYRTWYTKATDDGELSCCWVMPFEKSCEVSLENVGGQDVKVVSSMVRHGEWSWDDRSLHFHATWRSYNNVSTGGEEDEKREMDGHHARDVNYVTVDGAGVYVGDTLAIYNGAAHWWGEGDEKIYVDGEDFPSHIGTGTEDYYGYAWCLPAYFQAPFHAQPQGGGNLDGGFSVNDRYRALDAIPFHNKIQFDMELWHWAHTKVDYAPTALFYARPGSTVNVSPDRESAAREVRK